MFAVFILDRYHDHCFLSQEWSHKGTKVNKLKLSNKKVSSTETASQLRFYYCEDYLWCNSTNHPDMKLHNTVYRSDQLMQIK